MLKRVKKVLVGEPFVVQELISIVPNPNRTGHSVNTPIGTVLANNDYMVMARKGGVSKQTLNALVGKQVSLAVGPNVFDVTNVTGVLKRDLFGRLYIVEKRSILVPATNV